MPSEIKQVPRLFGIAAEFESPEAILYAARLLREHGYIAVEAYTPMPVEGLSQELGQHRTAVPAFCLLGACIGVGGGFFMQWFANVVHFRWNIGGRPPNSWPAFVPITFELGILLASFGALIAMLLINALPQPFHPMFRLDRFARASQDRFFLCIESTDPQFDESKIRMLFEALKPLAIMEVPR
jgi:hypothetical protein